MYNHVTVIPDDKIVLVDGQALKFDFVAPEGMHALQWRDGAGHIEWKAGENEPLAGQDYAAKVKRFAEAWEAEKARLEAEANRPPSPEEQLAAFTAAIQAHLDDFAKTRNYDGIMSAATYATSAVPKFRMEGQYAVAARDAVWAKGYELMDAVLAGTRPMPDLEEVLAELPALEWPEG